MPKHRREEKEHSRKRSHDDGDDNIHSDDDRDAKRLKKRLKKHRKKKKHKKEEKKHRRRHRHRSDQDESSSDSDNASSNDVKGDSNRKTHRRKSEDRKSSSKKRRRDREPTAVTPELSQHDRITQRLYHLFQECPLLASELPILLIRLAGGSNFDLSSMTDPAAARGLHQVLKELEEFGVVQEGKEWTFRGPPGSRRDELVLLRVLRGFLDDAGVTMQAVADYEAKQTQKQATETTLKKPTEGGSDESPSSQLSPSEGSAEDHALKSIHALTSSVVLTFRQQDENLGQQLAGLCQAIAQGESISIDGLPDESLKQSLENIFVQCGLEKTEMEDDDSDDDEEEEERDDECPLMGFGIPEANAEQVQIRLAKVMEACRNPQKRVLGPSRPSVAETNVTYSSEDDEGPALPGQERRPRGPTLSADAIKAQADFRVLELQATAAGVEIPKTDPGGREEWMIVPGKFDFLSSIKSGQPIKSRSFQSKKSSDDKPHLAIHPKIQAEMDAIMNAHQQARGPSLFDQHRAKKQLEKQDKAQSGGKGEWKWNREKDLDSDRRVDKDALHMVLGGAKNNLQTKFQGGFNR